MKKAQSAAKMLKITKLRKLQARRQLQAAQQVVAKKEAALKSLAVSSIRAQNKAATYAQTHFLAMQTDDNRAQGLSSICVGMFKYRRDIAALSIRQTKVKRDHSAAVQEARQAMKRVHRIDMLEDFCTDTIADHDRKQSENQEEEILEENTMTTYVGGKENA